MSTLSNRSSVVGLAGFAIVAVVGAAVAEAWPIRGPVARAERRVVRAQSALERELARPLGRVRVIEVPVYPISPGGVPSAGTAMIPAPGMPPQAVVPSPTQAAGRPAVPPMASPSPAGNPGVARTAFEAPAPDKATATPRPASPAEPASDGTVSVLVQPEAKNAGPQPAQGRVAEPLRFPGASQP